MTKLMCKTATMFAAALMFQGVSMAAPAADAPADRPAAREGAQPGAQPAAARDAAEAAGRREAGREADANFDQKFVEFAANNDLYEIALGNIVKEKAQSDEIKRLAQMMVDEHTQSSRQLQQAAQAANIQVPSQMDEAHQAKLKKMQEKSGRMLDRAYAIDQTAGHVKAVLKFHDATQMAQKQELKQFATTALPKLQQHFQHAARLSGWQQAQGEAQPAGARERGTGAGTGSGTGTGTGTDGTGAAPRSGAGASGTDRGQTSGATSGGQGPTGPGGAGDTGSSPRNR
jgi:putative membrane protein